VSYTLNNLLSVGLKTTCALKLAVFLNFTSVPTCGQRRSVFFTVWEREIPLCEQFVKWEESLTPDCLFDTALRAH